MSQRILVLSTNGAQVTVERNEMTPLELAAVFTILLDSIKAGQFPMPNGMPELALKDDYPKVAYPAPQTPESFKEHFDDGKVNVDPISSSN